MKYGKKIKHMLAIRGMTQEELAVKSGVSLSLIAALANDKRETTTDITLEKLAKAFGIPVKYFFDDEIVTPMEALGDHLPDDIKQFIMQEEESLDYLRLAKDISQSDFSPNFIREIISHYRTAMSKDKK